MDEERMRNEMTYNTLEFYSCMKLSWRDLNISCRCRYRRRRYNLGVVLPRTTDHTNQISFKKIQSLFFIPTFLSILYSLPNPTIFFFIFNSPILHSPLSTINTHSHTKTTTDRQTDIQINIIKREKKIYISKHKKLYNKQTVILL